MVISKRTTTGSHHRTDNFGRLDRRRDSWGNLGGRLVGLTRRGNTLLPLATFRAVDKHKEPHAAHGGLWPKHLACTPDHHDRGIRPTLLTDDSCRCVHKHSITIELRKNCSPFWRSQQRPHWAGINHRFCEEQRKEGPAIALLLDDGRAPTGRFFRKVYV